MREGDARGSETGKSDASDQQATIQANQTAAASPVPGGTYVPNLPNGNPGYALPEDQRTLSCVGIDATTGQCVGD
jgi:hypothetical protein